MCWKLEYIILIIISTLIDYFAGLMIAKRKNKKEKKYFLYMSLACNLGLLFAFKYFNFFNSQLKLFFKSINIFYNVPAFKVLLPVGISFYTFQTLSYTIDVYRGRTKPIKHLGIFALYVSFFPQLVAGPIERSSTLLPQFFEYKKFDYERFCKGLQLILWGYFKKVVIADRLAIYVNFVYSHEEFCGAVPFIIATYFFAIQIYCDFSGYSDIAIGSARLMGYELMTNFKQPYFSKSIREFWQRWHISLSSWFKDYLYIPLGGNRVSELRRNLNVFIVFLISGLWHGANWTFLFWGGLHGTYMLVGHYFKKIVNKWNSFIRKLQKIKAIFLFAEGIKIIFVFHLVWISWIFFRAESISQAFSIIKKIILLAKGPISFPVTMSPADFVISIGLIIFLIGIDFLLVKYKKENKFLNNLPVVLRWTLYYILIFGILFLGVFNEVEFIYFQF